jgi:septal ring factor EnvC (AmiA/AmiB activator)
MSRYTTPHRRLIATASALVAIAALLTGLALLPARAAGAGTNLNQLNSELGASQARQQNLSASLASVRSMIASLNAQISLVESREASVQAQLAQDQTRLATAQTALTQEQKRVAVLRAQLARAQMILARQLRSNYEDARPDLMSVVLESDGFNQLLEQLQFLNRAEAEQKQVIGVTRLAKARADSAEQRLAHLKATDQQITDATAVQPHALAGMNALLHSRQAALADDQAAEQAALAAARARGAQLQSAISRVEAEQAAARAAAALLAGTGYAATGALGPSAGWAIPYPIVLCESGGQNLPPNSVGASCYYQIIPSTWRLYGGTGPAAYLTSKAEQDAVAARIWDGGAGASNWVCAGIVGIS